MRLLNVIYFALGLVVQVSAQADGNPHGWDRIRRCDHTDYNPPCGLCEGVGGIAWGDDNKDITLTSCTPIADASKITNAPKPLWTDSWKADPAYEVLIGKKTDPFCFASFPSNSSDGTLCYKPDYGVQYYDMKQSKALRFDLNEKTSVGNVTSSIIHQGVNFWVVNKLPWYAAGQHQCICSHVEQGADRNSPMVYPVNPKWTQQMFLIGQEKIGVEYTGKEMVLNHWAFGPHHAWADPVTGQIYRMWQPFNGLNVFPNGITEGDQDQSRFETPPPLCKKGGATFRIGCDDDGYPKDPVASPAPVKSGGSKATPADLARAEKAVPHNAFRGEDFEEMSYVLNGWLVRGDAETRDCEEWSTEELLELQALLYLLRDAGLDEVYQAVNDNRRLRDSLTSLETDWTALDLLVDTHFGDDPDHEVHTVRRDGHCHEAVMWFVHHLSQDVKNVLAESGVVIPLLSKEYHHPPAASNSPASAAEQKVYGVYAEQVSCASCHSNF